MAKLNPGHYKLEVHYRSPVAINIPADLDWQTAILQVIVMWFEFALAVSDAIKFTPTTINAYNNWGPIRDIETILQIPSTRTVLSAYQFSIELSSHYHEYVYFTRFGWFTTIHHKFT